VGCIPSLRYRTCYLLAWIHSYQLLVFQSDKRAAFIRSDEPNTVKSLRDLLQHAVQNGMTEGFPIITNDRKVIGYIGTNELEHALSTPQLYILTRYTDAHIAMVADNANATCHFYPVRDTPDYEPESVSSSMYEEDGGMRDLFDFTIYMDRVGTLYLPYRHI
jgi:hypothetical protein